MDEGIKIEFGNTNSREIWKNSLLCAQFLRGYTHVPLLADVMPEDIEDITEILRPFIGVEYEGDAIKRIRLHDAGNREIYVIGLLEHKSGVDYDITFQLLKYMVGIWALHRNRMNREQEGCSERKGFRYPLIIPVVYYEGRENWTADMYWGDRVDFSREFGQYVPDFTYEVVDLHRYSNEELLSREEELSFLMVLNRIQTREDMKFSEWPVEQRAVMEKILKKAPKDVLHIMAQVMYHFGLKMNLPDRELAEYVKNVEERDMGELWANMEKIDIPEIRRQIRREEREEARKEAWEEARKEVREEIESLKAEIERLRGDKAEAL